MYSIFSLPITSHSSIMASPAPPPAARSLFSSNGSNTFLPFPLTHRFTGEISGQSYRAKTTWTEIHSVEAKATTRRESRTARHERVRKKVHGTPERPRLCVFRSNKHLYAQVIDDTKMHTLAAASTMQKPVTEEIDFSSGPTIEVAKKVGEAIAKSCLEKGITQVAFDRGGYPYHGRVQALADAARVHGLLF